MVVCAINFQLENNKYQVLSPPLGHDHIIGSDNIHQHNSNFQVLQGSVVTHLGCGGKYS